ncbi:MAG: ATP-binding protein [Candidatus Woesearchaeota archaeon]
MIVGKIFGKTTTTEFRFVTESDVNKFDFVQVYHPNYDYVLCQIIELEMDEDKTIAKCNIIGYKDKDGKIKQIRMPFKPQTEVLIAEDDFIRDIIQISEKDGAYVGKLEGKNIPIYLDLKKLLTKHIAVLAKSGSGKSYTVGVLLEEILELNVPLLIIDPHGEYSSMKYANDDQKDIAAMQRYGVKPKRYTRQIREYGFINDMNPLKLNDDLKAQELIHLLPTRLSSAQLAILYNAVKNLKKIDFTNLILELEMEESPSKYNIISVVDHLKAFNLFSVNYTPYNELIQPGRCSIVNLKGLPPEAQEIVVYKLMKDLFDQRKINKIPPFFVVVEEAHNFCPERGFGESKSSKILRTVASEGRKFGLGLCVITQRPARLDKSVLSQCTTQIILKVTNPNDLKAVLNSVEGINTQSEKEIQNLPIGSSLITGVVDMPLFVNIRPRKTKHGGVAVNILQSVPQNDDDKFFEELDEHKDTPAMPMILPKITEKDIRLMSTDKINSISKTIVPAVLFLCEHNSKSFNLLVDQDEGAIVRDVNSYKASFLPNLSELSEVEMKILQNAFHLKKFTKEQMISKTGNMNIVDTLKSLLQKGYILYSSGTFVISEKYVLSHLSNHASYEKIEFTNVSYDKKLPKKIPVDRLKEKLSRFVNIKDQRECYVLKYDVK